MSNINPNPIDPVEWKKEFGAHISSEQYDATLKETVKIISFLDKKIAEASSFLKNPELHQDELKELHKTFQEEMEKIEQSSKMTIESSSTALEKGSPIVKDHLTQKTEELQKKMHELGKMLGPYGDD